MKHQLCRNCGHRHPLGALCTGLEAKPREDVLLKPPTKILMPAFSSEEDVVAAKKLLTSAQKQKAYRERHKDRVREANRLRMAAKRKE